RLRLWAGDSGAHRTGQVSLDFQLRYSSQVHDKVVEYLEALDVSLHSALSIIQNCGTVPPYSPSFSSSCSDSSTDIESLYSEEGLPSTTPLQYTVEDIALRIECLMRLLMVLRQPAPRDRTEKYAKITMAHFEQFDIDHVMNKFPQAPLFLAQRLGKANTQRRQLFKYLEQHSKIVRYIDEDDDNKTISRTLYSQTSVTDVHWFSRPLDTLETDCLSEDGQTATSYSPSTSGDSCGFGSYLSVPPPPKLVDYLGDHPFICCYCHYFINPTTKKSWERHVFRDLMPYVCTFEDCMDSSRLFESRREWSDHELRFHRREWYCAGCKTVFESSEYFRRHVSEKHPELPALEESTKMCERASFRDEKCPICLKCLRADQFDRHLARHMQQIALFCLPDQENEPDGINGPENTGDVIDGYRFHIDDSLSGDLSDKESNREKFVDIISNSGGTYKSSASGSARAPSFASGNQQIPFVLGFDTDREYIAVNDFCDSRRWMLPFHLCKEFEDMVSMIRSIYMCKGNSYIGALNKYNFHLKHNNTGIGQHNWESKVVDVW
ncbi:hypothetical protein EDC01DRAFT_744303, partial [Geopyxis carbonaria]